MNFCSAFANCEQCCFIHEIGEVGAAHARSTACDEVEVDISVDTFVANMHIKNLAAVFEFRQWNYDLAVKATRTEKRWIEDVRSVSRRHHDNAGGDFEAVHLGEHLVERLLALIVATAEAGTALAANRIDLIDEDDGSSHLPGAGEEVAHAACANANEHLHEV
ncbi:unannotated protein [freshwater metagenome]|uniref:Unannotated protein n=1 Tax=freshwater metagenome TaxID=449393 RepID=A0A6J6LHE5_9ZZZZ